MADNVHMSTFKGGETDGMREIGRFTPTDEDRKKLAPVAVFALAGVAQAQELITAMTMEIGLRHGMIMPPDDDKVTIAITTDKQTGEFVIYMKWDIVPSQN